MKMGLKICAEAKKAVAENKKIEKFLSKQREQELQKIKTLWKFARSNKICPLCSNGLSHSEIKDFIMRNFSYKCVGCKTIFIRKGGYFDKKYFIKEIKK